MAPAPLFSVIVPTYHRNESLSQCLDRLSPGVQSLSSHEYEVIVTDDGSRTTAEQLVTERYGWAKWVAGPGKGPAANRNNGAKYAAGDWLAFIDDDCLPDPQWLKAYADAIATNPHCYVFEGRVYVNRPKRSLAETSPLVENGGYLISANFVCQKDVFNSLGGFDERFPYAAMEDVDLRLRLTKAGYKFSFIKEAAVCHPWRQIGGWEAFKQHQESTLIYLSLHPDQISKINSIYYLKASFYKLLKVTIPETIKYRGKGIKHELLAHCSNFKMALLLDANLHPYKKRGR